ncbi:MAG: shikimate dehydrogenase [Gemmatimonadales bacterium]
MITGRTRLFALLGDPVAHSLSPAMHNAAFRALGLDAAYLALRTGAAEVPAVMRTLAGSGGGGNVTVPHKRLAATVVEPADGYSLPICNTFWSEDGRIAGCETDSIGVTKAFEALGAPGGDWLVLGTGGSAVAVARAAARLGVGLAVRSRVAERAAAFSAEAARIGAGRASGPVGLVVNTTPLGLGPADPLPMPLGELPPGAAVLDLAYRPGGTAFSNAARAAGRRAIDGVEVLIAQGVAAFRCWFPTVPAPTEVMRAAVARALA